ncbi:MAG: AraC family transcriptional regulator [Bacteroidota bacterium]
MKPIFEKVLLGESSFLIKEEHFKHFNIPSHIHPEFELALLLQGEGKKCIGDHISKIQAKDLILIGPNIIHSWFAPEALKQAKLSKQIVIQFPNDFLGTDFFEHSAFNKIKNLLQNSYRGLAFNANEAHPVVSRIKKMLTLNDFDRTIELLKILNILAGCRKTMFLSSMGYSSQLNRSESARLNAIYGYILDHYKIGLDLNSVARFANMTPQAFSSYFKKRTRRNFISFLNEVKVGCACKLLSEKKFSISQICFESGFSNLSNFNRQFKNIMSMTPTQYVKEFE